LTADDTAQRRATAFPADRIVRQVHAIDRWIVARREREQALHAASSTHDEQRDVARQVEALRRTHDTIRGRCARGLAAKVEPLCCAGTTAVIAHGHAWFADKAARGLAERGVTVLGCTDNGADALGLVVAEQPDVVLVGDHLAMMTWVDLLAEARRFAPSTLRAAQAADEQQAVALGDADAVFLRRHPPADVAKALVALHQAAASGAGRRSCC
jgi:hypothetical protein